MGKGDKVGIVGLGGLGHMGVKFAHAFGAHVVLFTTSASKAEDARRLGANSGSRYFCESFFGHPCPKKRQKLRDR